MWSLFVFQIDTTEAQQLDPGSLGTGPSGFKVGVPTAGERGVSRTTGEIMARAQKSDQQVSRAPRHLRPQPLRDLDRENPKWGQNGFAMSEWLVPITALDKSGTPITDTPQTLSAINFNAITGPYIGSRHEVVPDTMGCVGPTQFLVVINGRLRTFNKATGTADGVLDVDSDVFFAPVLTPAPPGGDNVTFDPQVRYDRLTQRWFATMGDLPSKAGSTIDTPNRVLLAVSDGARGGTLGVDTVWTFFFVQQDTVGGIPSTGEVIDFPSLGVDNNALYIGGDMFSLQYSQISNTSVFVIRKSSVLGAGPIVTTAFRGLSSAASPDGAYAPRGVDNFDPVATEGYFIGLSARELTCNSCGLHRLDLLRVSDPGGTPSISDNIIITIPTAGIPISVDHKGNQYGNEARLIAYGWLLGAHIRDGRLWTAHSIAVDAKGAGATSGLQRRDGVRWYELIVPPADGGTPTVKQAGTIFDSTTMANAARQYLMPSIMVSGQGHAALGFSTAGTPFYIDAATTGRLAGDPPGITGTVELYTASNTSYNHAPYWGDYSFTSLDPSDDMTMWTIQEYCNGTDTYGLRVVKLLAPPPAMPSSVSPATIPAGQSSITVTVTGTQVAGSGFYDPPVTGILPAPNRLTASLGSGITINNLTYNGPTSVTLNLNTSNATPGSAYLITITNPDGQSQTSASNLLTVGAPLASLANISTRLSVQTGDNALFEGFIVQGPAGSSKKIMVRALGPFLGPFGVPEPLANPTLDIFEGNNKVATNNDWRATQIGGLITGDQSAEIASSGLAPSNDLESAIIANLAPGSYTALVRGLGNTVGTGLVDAYDLSASSPAKVVNFATRGLVQPGDKLLIAGFIIQSGPVRAVIRAIGPSLIAFNITNALPDTTLQLRDQNGVIVRENDDWETDQKQELLSTGLQPTNAREAALVQTIQPGQYTAQVRGKPEATGIGVVEIYFSQ